MNAKAAGCSANCTVVKAAGKSWKRKQGRVHVKGRIAGQLWRGSISSSRGGEFAGNHQQRRLLEAREGGPRVTASRRAGIVVVSQASINENAVSTRNIASELYDGYQKVLRWGISPHVFVETCVMAFSCGCSEEGLRKELLAMSGGDERVRGGKAIPREEVEECVLWIAVCFVTILSTPQPMVRRWSVSPAVSTDSLVMWKGFCTLIANAYYVQGMAWYSVRRLQLEQLAVAGEAEEAAVISERMRLVFTTLDVVDPRWGPIKDHPAI